MLATQVTVEDVRLPTVGAELPGVLMRLEDPRGLVLFAHGRGSSHRSARNEALADVLTDTGFDTLRFDLLTPAEMVAPACPGDVEVMTERLLDATLWARTRATTEGLPFGYFGAGTGAAAALAAAAALGRQVRAVVSRGGWPDRVTSGLMDVLAPTLLIVGEDDPRALAANRAALEELPGTREIAVIPHATHHFEEPGAIGDVARLASDWFRRYLTARDLYLVAD